MEMELQAVLAAGSYEGRSDAPKTDTITTYARKGKAQWRIHGNRLSPLRDGFAGEIKLSFSAVATSRWENSRDEACLQAYNTTQCHQKHCLI